MKTEAVKIPPVFLGASSKQGLEGFLGGLMASAKTTHNSCSITTTPTGTAYVQYGSPIGGLNVMA